MATPGTTYFTYKIYPDGTFEQVLSDQGLFQGWGPFAGSKFLKGSLNSGEVAYMRPSMGASYFYVFDGTLFTKAVSGLVESEIRWAPENSMAIKNDTLFAGFNGPARSKP
ncbi:MAG: hypothetical protein M1378_14135 [Bacteroidetes bacterium]|nr:hypothetical protein [Bacteroidota bacterium]